MNTLNLLLRYISLIPLSYLTTILFAPELIKINRALIPSTGGMDVDFTDFGTILFTLAASFVFFLILFGEQKYFKNFISITVACLIILTSSLDPMHFWFPTGLILSGLGFGYFLRLFISRIIGSTSTGKRFAKYF